VLRPFVLAGAAVRELFVHQMGSVGDAELVAEATLGALRRTQDPAAVRLLSAREVDVLSLLPTLLSMEEIADELDITINTVKSHSRAIYTKLGVSSRRGAVVAAHERGLLHIRPAAGGIDAEIPRSCRVDTAPSASFRTASASITRTCRVERVLQFLVDLALEVGGWNPSTSS
jgi:DNA-binding CsgD family transcriptional regulator